MRFWKNFRKYHEYALYEAKARLKSEVASSYLNWIWWILEPFLTMLIYIFVFGYILKASEPNYAVFLFIGILMWNYFSGVVRTSVLIVKINQNIISKVYVPKYILLISNMYQYACKFGFGLLVEFIMMKIFHIPFGWHILLALPFFIVYSLLAFGISSILIHFGVYIYDLTYVIGIVLSFIMYLSGVFYSIEGRLPGTLGKAIGKFNPVAFFISSMRDILIYKKMPSFQWLLIWCIISIVLAFVGITLIHKNENDYAKVI